MKPNTFFSPTPPRPKMSKSEFEARELYKEFHDCLPSRESFKKTDLYKAMKEAKANGHYHLTLLDSYKAYQELLIWANWLRDGGFVITHKDYDTASGAIIEWSGKNVR